MSPSDDLDLYRKPLLGGFSRSLLKVASVLGFVAVSMLSCATHSANGGRLTTPAGFELYWRAEAFPLQVQIHPYFSEEEYQIMKRGAEVWNREVGLTVIEVLPRTPDFDDSYEHYGHIAFEPARLGRTSTGSKTFGSTRFSRVLGTLGELGYSRILIDFSILHLPETLESVTTHEIGHALGLAHDPNDYVSVMFPYNHGLTYYVQPADVQAIRRMMRE